MEVETLRVRTGATGATLTFLQSPEAVSQTVSTLAEILRGDRWTAPAKQGSTWHLAGSSRSSSSSRMSSSPRWRISISRRAAQHGVWDQNDIENCTQMGWVVSQRAWCAKSARNSCKWNYTINCPNNFSYTCCDFCTDKFLNFLWNLYNVPKIALGNRLNDIWIYFGI